MGFGEVIEQVLRQGMAGQSRARLEHSVGPGGLGGVPGLEDLLGSILGGGAAGRTGGGGLGDVFGGNPSRRGPAGGLDDLLGSVLGGGRGGGLGDVLGSVLGGGQAGAARGGSRSGAGMAILATIAMAALRNWSRSRGGSAMGLMDPGVAPGEMQALTAPETERLVLQAMISAAKADGTVDQSEIERILDGIDDDGVSPEEKAFVAEELQKPIDIPSLAAAVPNAGVAAQLYGASLFAMKVDSKAEVAYLRRLAEALGLDDGTVARLHQLTGAPGA